VKKGSDEHYAKGGEDAAIADIDLALARQPGAGELLLLRGLWKASKGDVEGALGDFSSAEKSPQILTRARYHRARLLLEAGAADSQDEVEGEFTVLMDAFKDNPDLRHFRGLARVRREDWSGAIADFSAVLEDRPESAVVYNDRGDAQRALRDYDPALRDYDRAIELAPDWPQAWRDRGYLEHLLAKYGAAERDFRKALAINGSDSEALNGLGLVALAKGEGDLAAVEFDKAILARPQSGVYFANRGAASWVAGDLTAALADFERSILLDPKEPYIRLFEFLALARLGDRALAAARLRAYLAADAEAGWPRPIMDYLLGPGSLEVIEAAVDDAPDDKRDGYRFDRDFYLGQWALVRGDRPGATKRLQEVFDSQLREYLEYDLARADLVALGVKVAD
jgi:tetratricopeptide (TPR) repeat protein